MKAVVLYIVFSLYPIGRIEHFSDYILRIEYIDKRLPVFIQLIKSVSKQKHRHSKHDEESQQTKRQKEKASEKIRFSNFY